MYTYIWKKQFFSRGVLTLQIEFFGPLCDLVEGSLEVEVGGLEVSSRVEVPSLTELCVRCVHTEKLGEGKCVITKMYTVFPRSGC